MMYYNENTKVLQSEAPWGDKYYSEKAKEKYFSEWQQVDDDFIPPVSDEKKALVDKKETEKAFKEAKVPLVTLTDYDAVIETALKTGYIEEKDIPTLNEWRKDPAHWGDDLK